ncbi:MAG: hypothetical protein JNN11_03150 [Candidatus Doudnabacteria bacterium]|nr:hypothetical protein [Candidatus Doudnabacteria bacterium]
MHWTFRTKSFNSAKAELEPFFDQSFQDSLGYYHQIIITTGRKNYSTFAVEARVPALEFNFRILMYPSANLVVGKIICRRKTRLREPMVGVVLTDCYKIKTLLLFSQEAWDNNQKTILSELEANIC